MLDVAVENTLVLVKFEVMNTRYGVHVNPPSVIQSTQTKGVVLVELQGHRYVIIQCKARQMDTLKAVS